MPCLSLLVILFASSVSQLSALLVFLFAFLFASSLRSLVSLVCCFICLPFSSPRHCIRSLDSLLCCFLPFSLPCQSLISLFCCFFCLSQVSLRLAAVALGLTPLLLLDCNTLHEPCSHMLRLRRRHCRRRRRRPAIVKIRCTPHYMGLAQACPN